MNQIIIREKKLEVKKNIQGEEKKPKDNWFFDFLGWER